MYTKGLYLLDLDESHVDHLMTWVNDREVREKFAKIGDSDITREQELEWIKSTILDRNVKCYSVFEQRLNEQMQVMGRTYVGHCSISNIYWPARRGTIGIILAPAHRGQGIGRTVMDLCLRQAFRELNLNKIELIHFRSNGRMAKLAERSGFTVEGCLRKHYMGADGELHDMVTLGLLRDEWSMRRHERSTY